MNTSSAYKHSISSAYKRLDPKNKNEIINLISSQINKIKSIQNELLRQVESFLSINTSLNLELVKYKTILKSHLLEIKNNDRCFIYRSENNEESLKTQDFVPIKSYLKKLEVFKGILPVLNDFEAFYQTLNTEEIENHEKTSESIFFTTDESNKLYYFDLETLKVESIYFNSIDFRRWGTAFCLTEDQKVFAYGGRAGRTLDDAYLINPITITFESLPSGLPRGQISAECIENQVYVFGGWTISENSTNNSSRYDIKERKWSLISLLPEKTRNTSTLKLNSDILITGMTENLFLYSISQNNYRTIRINFELTAYNLLLKYQNKIIIVTGNEVYSDSNLDFLNASKTNTRVSFGTITSKPSFWKNSEKAYFVDFKGRVFQLNCETLTLLEVESNR